MQLCILQILFGKYNFEISTAINGYEAFELVSKSLTSYQSSKDRKDLFDLVILDLNMPISNGFEACKNIHKIFDKTQLTSNQGNDSKDDSCNLSLVNNKDLMPLIIACSSEQLTIQLQ
jgi:CheY-like chemotaxis protein